MALDFEKLNASAGKKVLDPRKIFTTLNRAPKFRRPSDQQGEVLDAWLDKRSRVDNTLKMNTGAGKTLVGLLILQSSLNEGVSPALYVTPDNYLVDQVVRESKELGIQTTTNVDDPDYLSGKAILVINVQKLINGKSVFGVGTQGIRIPVGSLIVDDAHACLQTVWDQFSIKLGNSHEVYEKLFKLFQDDLSFQSRIEFLSIEAEDSRAFLRVPFWAWQSQQREVSKILHAHRFDDEIQFNFPLLADVLPLCQCVIGGNNLEISPRCLPIDMIPSFGRARRRIYMTATLADDGILVTHFNANADSVGDPIRPKGAGDIGDRLILAPQEITPTITKDEVKKFLATIARKENVVVIAPSFKAADYWKDSSQLVLDRKNLADGVKRLKGGHVGLCVLVNKYDGIDLPDKACRVLVIDGLPEVYGLTERNEMLVLEGTALELARQVQRIEQGMGRGVRSSDDYCVVLLLGAKLTQRVHLPGAREKFNPATLTQIDLGKAVSEQVRGKALKELRPIIDLCLNQDAKWLHASRSALVSAEEGAKSHIDQNAVLNRRAFDQARSADYPGALSTVQESISATSDAATRGYQKQLAAEYLNFFDQSRAQEMLKSAIKENARVLKPIVGITYSKLSNPTAAQAKAVVENLTRYATPNELTLHVNSILEDLTWNEDGTKAFEAALADAGLLLGFGSQRPELEAKEGPDNLWALGGLKYLVIECKSGATTATISKGDSDQLSGALNWFKDTYDQSCGATPIMIHPSHFFDLKASPHETVRVIDKEHLEKFRVALRQYIHAITSANGLDNTSLIGDQLKHHALTGGSFIDRYSRRFSKK